MTGILILLVLLGILFLVLYTWELRGKLVKSEYWKTLPKGPEYYGICLPIALFVILSAEEVGFFHIMLCLVLTAIFLLYVIGQSKELKQKLPAEVHKKVTRLYILSPLLSLSVMVAILWFLAFIFGIWDMLKRKKK